VASHVVHIFDKLNFSSRAQVAVWAAEHKVQTGAVN
jgi:DNA-binding NarL/FixJ family response regulator